MKQQVLFSAARTVLHRRSLTPCSRLLWGVLDFTSRKRQDKQNLTSCLWGSGFNRAEIKVVSRKQHDVFHISKRQFPAAVKMDFNFFGCGNRVETCCDVLALSEVSQDDEEVSSEVSL